MNKNSELQLAERLKALAARVSELERLESGRFSGARVYHDSDQSISSATSTDLVFNSERFDSDGYHSIVSNIGRFTVPVNGYYLIEGNIQFESNSTGIRQIVLRLNNATTLAILRVDASATSATILSLSTIYQMNAGDYVNLRVFQDSGVSLNVGAVGNYSPEFAIARLG